MKVIHLQKGVGYLREFVKKAQKHMPDRNNRGYPDSILHLNDVLDGLEDLMNYVDDIQLNYYKKKNIQSFKDRYKSRPEAKKLWLNQTIQCDEWGRPPSLADVPLTYMSRKESFKKLRYSKETINKVYEENNNEM